MVFTVLLQQQLFVNLSKCDFGSSQMEYLGHIISAHQVAIDPKKVSYMLAWPILKTFKELRGFLGFTGYYRKFIKNYGVIAQPLTQLLKKGDYQWSSEAQVAFDNLKQAMTKAPILVLPDFILNLTWSLMLQVMGLVRY